MKKLILGCFLLTLMVIITACSSSNNSQSASKSKPQSDKVAINKVDACDVLTGNVARKILGLSAQKADTSAGNTATNDIAVSNCSYTVRIDANKVGPNNTRGISLLARSAKTDLGAQSNQDIFGAKKPVGVQDVSGFGDKAFFNAQYGQLNVLKGGNYYIVTSYTGSPQSASLDLDKALAKLLTFK